MGKRKVAIFTGNRAEYGLQYPIIKAVAAHVDLDYRLLVSGAHLQEDFGRTIEEIRKDGFEIHAEVKLNAKGDTLYGTAQAIGSGILSLSEILREDRPDFLVVYADRFEGLAAVVAGSQMGIPVAHIEGGDITEGGALDDMVRHAMTKLAHLHFTTNEDASERIRKLGEEHWRVHNVGFPAIDLIAAGHFAKADELESRYGLRWDRPIVLFTQHSVTTETEQVVTQVLPSLRAMEKLAAEGWQVIVTYPNNDAGGRRIIEEIEKLNARRVPNLQVHRNLGRYNYHGILSACGTRVNGVCVGNSSSGIKETPAFGCPAVNIGSRQDGRLRADNVLDVGYDEDAILAAIRKSIGDPAFRRQCRDTRESNPYGTGNSGPRIAETLARTELGPRLIQKKMTY
jgi:UDP-hydrolysing UDP-N-acetyl-D-glucosamine 2-epimerase